MKNKQEKQQRARVHVTPTLVVDVVRLASPFPVTSRSSAAIPVTPKSKTTQAPLNNNKEKANAFQPPCPLALKPIAQPRLERKPKRKASDRAPAAEGEETKGNRRKRKSSSSRQNHTCLMATLEAR